MKSKEKSMENLTIDVVNQVLGVCPCENGLILSLEVGFCGFGDGVFEILPPKKRARSRSSSSTSALPQVFEIGESSHKTHLERHEEQIETILNHLDELPLERIEHIEDKVEGLGNGQAVIGQLVPDSVAAALKVLIGGLPHSIKGTVTASKPQTLEEAITITQCLMDQDLALSGVRLATSEGRILTEKEKGHYKYQCPKANNNAHGKSYLKRDKNARQDSNVVTGTFLLNQHLARVLFNSGADKSFVSISLAFMLNIPSITIDTFYDIDMADGNLFLGHVIDSQGIHVDPAKIEAIAKSLTELTQKNKKYIWGEDQESAFQLLKQKLYEALILALPEGNDNFVVYYDASHQGLGAVMAPKRISTSTTPPMTQAAIKKLVADSVSAALKAQAATMANTDNTNKNTRPREIPVARKCSYKEFMSYQPFNFKGTEGVVGLIHWFERTESVFSCSNYTDDCKVKFVTGTLTEEALSWKMEDEFYNLVVKGNDLKTYARRFQELATLCPNMVPNNEKLMEVFIRGLPQSIEGTVTASKP
ncbi:reverse transcriptase domain-containing protein [Tanacetum coccineum]